MKNALKEDLAMKKKIMLIPLLLLLIGCSQKVTEEDLIGGKWIGTAGHENGKAKGESNCFPFQDGIEFKDENTVYVERFEREFEYWINEDSDITFGDAGSEDPSPDIGYFFYSYQIKMISKDEVVLEGVYALKNDACHMERQ